MTPTLKVLSYNIHKGFSPLSTRAILTQLKAAIQTTGAQLVFLQEVLGHHKKYAPKEAQFEFLADQIWPHYAYAKNAVYTLGNHGNAILSEYPIVEQHWFDLSTNPVEQRGLLHITIDLKNLGLPDPLHLFNVHLNLFEGGRRLQLDLICKKIQEVVPSGQPLILAGDFNDWGKKAGEILAHSLALTDAHKVVHGVEARTFPSLFPFLSLDRIYTRGLAIQEVKVLQGPPYSELSDHLPLYSKIALS